MQTKKNTYKESIKFNLYTEAIASTVIQKNELTSSYNAQTANVKQKPVSYADNK